MFMINSFVLVFSPSQNMRIHLLLLFEPGGEQSDGIPLSFKPFLFQKLLLHLHAHIGNVRRLVLI